MEVPQNEYILYNYDPSLAAAIVFIILFFFLTILHSFQLFKARTWYFTPFVIGGLFEFVGYIGRAISSTQSPNWALGPYVCQSLLILLAVPFFSASIYMMLSRIIRLTNGEARSIIGPKWLTKVFVTADVASFLTQSSGGAMLATAQNLQRFKVGEWVIVGGLFIQVVFFGFFVIAAGIFNYRIARRPTARTTALTLPWQKYLFVLYGASTLIVIRSIFRVIEYVQGDKGYLLRHEVYLYVFDATLMFFVMVLFNVWHPSTIITKEKLARDWDDPESSGNMPDVAMENIGMSTKIGIQ